jgi:Neurotransmitter-gated ion-channel ligand binding domain
LFGRLQSFDVDLYLYLSWRDASLNHSGEHYVLINDPKVREHIWLPDLYFANARTSKFHDVTVPNFNLFIAQDGTIAYSSRITLNVACNLNLVHYPMDQQSCAIRIVSCAPPLFNRHLSALISLEHRSDAYIEKQINASWFNLSSGIRPIRYNNDIELPEFNILGIDHSYCDGTYMYAIMDSSRYKIGQSLSPYLLSSLE